MRVSKPFNNDEYISGYCSIEESKRFNRSGSELVLYKYNVNQIGFRKSCFLKSNVKIVEYPMFWILVRK